METDTVYPAEAYLRNENNPLSLYVKIEGKRRRLFINRNVNVIGIVALGKRNRGYAFTNWVSIEKICYPSFMHVEKSLMIVNARREIIDILRITNRRFMYDPQTGILLLSRTDYSSAVTYIWLRLVG